MKKENILIVGANGKIAREIIKSILQQTNAKIVMACRSQQRGEEAKKAILREDPTADSRRLMVIGGFDMNTPNTIEAGIKALSNQKFDRVFLGAGGAIFTEEFQTTTWNNIAVEKNNFQNMMGAHFTLSEIVKLDMLAPNARVIMSGGEGARGITGMIDKPIINSADDLKTVVHGDQNVKYNPMNALGVSKFLGAIWTQKLAEDKNLPFEIVWFSPGLTYGTFGLAKLPPLKRWFMENIGFGFMRLLGQAQSPEDAGKKFADAILGKVGKHGEVIGAPEGKTIGTYTDQRPMNSSLTNIEVRNEYWSILTHIFGPFGVA